MYQIKFKQLLLTALCAVSATGVSASDWVGESREEEDATFYLYNVTAGKYLGTSGSAKPVLVDYTANPEDTDQPVLFTAQYKSSNNGANKDWVFQYTYTSNGTTTTYYLNNASNLYSTSSSTTYGVETLDGSTYYLGFKRKTLFQSDYWYIMWDNSTLGNVNSDDVSNNNQYQWNLISASQYKYRPKLDAMITTVTEYKNSLGEDKSSEISTLDAAITAAQSALLTSKCEDGYNTLTATYNRVVAGEGYGTASSDYQNEISQGYAVFYELQAKMGMVPTTLQTLLTTAETTLANANTAVSAADATSETISEQTESLNSALTVLTDNINVYKSPNVQYAAEMKAFAEKLGCPLRTSDVTTLLGAVLSEDETSIHTAIESAQTYFKGLANTDVTNGCGFPKGTDMTGFILNSSFETGTTYGWTTNGTAVTPTATNTSSVTSGGIEYTTTTYDLEKNNATYTQTLTNLPCGTYSLSAGSGNVYALDADGNQVTTFTISEGNTSQVIYISGSTIDDIKLTLVEGAASIYTFNESNGVDETSVRAGSFSTVRVTRTLKADTDGNWNTFCSPSSISNAEAIGTDENPGLFSQIMEMTGIQKVGDEITLLYTSSDSIVAGKAYLVKARSAVSQYTATNANVVKSIVSADYSSNDDKVKVVMVGTFAPLAAGSIPYLTGVDIQTVYGMSGVARTYILQKNTFKYLTSASQVSMSAFRAYFHIWEPTNDSGTFSAASVRMSFEEAGEETCIANINVKSSSDQIFDLNGHKVSAMTNGLYVKDGKKVFIQK